MDVEGRFSISPQALYVRLGTELAPIVVDVRRSPAFEADDTVIVGAVRRLPEEVDHWRSGLPEGRSVVVYCAHGQEVSQNTAAALRAAGSDACYLEHGIAGWAELGLPRRRKLGAGAARMGHPRAAQNRSDRLSLADPPVHRSGSRIPLRPDRARLRRRRRDRGHRLTTSPAPSRSRMTASCAASTPS